MDEEAYFIMHAIKRLTTVVLCITLVLNSLAVPVMANPLEKEMPKGLIPVKKDIEAAEITSLEQLAEEGLIDPSHYLTRKLLKEKSESYISNDKSFSKQMNDLIAECSSISEMLEDESLSKEVLALLKEKKDFEGVVKKSEDFEVLMALSRTTDKMLASNSNNNYEVIADLKFYIDDVILDESEVEAMLGERLKAVWTEDNKVILRWQHDSKWKPERGYNLYRIVGTKAKLIEHNIGLENKSSSGLYTYAKKNADKIKLDNVSKSNNVDASAALAKSLKELSDKAEVKDETLKQLGLNSKEEFDKLYKGSDSKVVKKVIKGNTLFEDKAAFELSKGTKGSFDNEELGLNTVLDGSEVNKQLKEETELIELTKGIKKDNIKDAKSKNIATEPSLNSNFGIGGIKPYGAISQEEITTNNFGIEQEVQVDASEGSEESAIQTVKELHNSRNMISAGADTDLELAKVMGLAYVDDIEGIAEKGEHVSYVLLPLFKDTKEYDLNTLGQKVNEYAGSIISNEDVNEDAPVQNIQEFNPQNNLFRPNIQKDVKLVRPNLKVNTRDDIVTEGETSIEKYILSIVQVGETMSVEKVKEVNGFALNNKAFLRWSAPIKENQDKIISGYDIYRKKNNEEDYMKLNDEPVIIPYSRTVENNISMNFESPIFYEDMDVKNGDKLSYKIVSLDIFGRTSGLSEASCDIETVVKTTWPESPLVDQAYLASLVKEGEAQDWLASAANEVNTSEKDAVILPISLYLQDSEVVQFNIYRSKAYGKSTYSQPQLLNSVKAIDKQISLDRFVNIQGEEVNTLEMDVNAIQQFLEEGSIRQEFQPGTYYLDYDIEKGNYYKYWVTAVDDWGNESMWATPVTIGYEQKTYMDTVNNLVSTVVDNIQVDQTAFAPGRSNSRIVSKARGEELEQLAAGKVDVLLPEQDVISHRILGDMTASVDIPGGALITPGNLVVEDMKTGDISIKPKDYFITEDHLIISDDDLLSSAMNDSTYGVSLTDSIVQNDTDLPKQISRQYMNLPDINQVQYLVSYNKGSFNPDGSLNVSWYAYSGNNLKEYTVYRGVLRNTTLDDLNNMCKSEVMTAMERLENVKTTSDNGFVDQPGQIGENDLLVYAVIVIPEDPTLIVGYDNQDQYKKDNALGGWVKVSWNAPNDSEQVENYKIYRAKVDGFDNVNYNNLKWEIVERKCSYNYYYQPLNQGYEQFYVYKIIPMNIWHVDGNPMYTNIRVPALIPPEQPTMLTSYSKPGQVYVRFTKVSEAKKYNVYRARVKKVTLQDLQLFITEAKSELFAESIEVAPLEETIADTTLDENVAQDDQQLTTPIITDEVINSEIVNVTAVGGFEEQVSNPGHTMNQDNFDGTFVMDRPIEAITKGGSNIVSALPNSVNVTGEITAVGSEDLTGEDSHYTSLEAFISDNVNDVTCNTEELYDLLNDLTLEVKELVIKKIIYKYGILSVYDYEDIEETDKDLIQWVKVGEQDADTANGQGEITYIDGDVSFGSNYYYSVSASNTDLESSKPEPVKGTCKLGKPLEKVENVQVANRLLQSEGEVYYWAADITWDHVKVNFDSDDDETNYLAGYIVYRSMDVDGEYYQVSGLIQDNAYIDLTNSPENQYYYKVKALNIAGFLSDFSEPSNQTGQIMEDREYLLATRCDGPIDVSFDYSDSSTDETTLEYECAQQSELLEVYQLSPPAIVNPRMPYHVGKVEGKDYIEGMANYIQQRGQYKMGDYLIEDIKLDSLKIYEGYANKEWDTYYNGRGNLVLGESRIKIPVNFSITDWNINHMYNENSMETYPSYIDQPAIIYEAKITPSIVPYYQKDIGLVISDLELEVTTHKNFVEGNHVYDRIESKGKISGILDNNGTPVLDDLDKIYLDDETIDHKGIINLKTLPVIYHDQYKIYDAKEIKLNLDYMNKNYSGTLNDNRYPFPITLKQGKAQSSFGYPTINNKGLVFDFNVLGIIPKNNNRFNLRTSYETSIKRVLSNIKLDSTYLQGDLGGIYSPLRISKPTTARFVVPSGIAVQMNRSKVYLAGEQSVARENEIIGHVTLPFFNAPDEYIYGDVFADLPEETEEDDIDRMLIKLLNNYKSDGLTLIGDNTENLASTPFNIKGIDLNDGFLIEHTTIDPAMVGNYDLYEALENISNDPDNNEYKAYVKKLIEQSFVLESSDISIDFSRIKRVKEVDAKKWYYPVDWKGIVYHNGSIKVSKSLFKKDDGAPVGFILEPEEMIYDRNGFIYQKYMKKEPGEEISIDFGEHFGGFTEAFVSRIDIDMYNNKFDLNTEGKVKIPALNYEEFDYRMFTNKETKLVEAVLRSKSFDFSNPSLYDCGEVSMDIYGGYFDELGVHMNGEMDIDFKNELVANDLGFSELLIPAKQTEMAVLRDDLGINETIQYGTAIYTRPYEVNFRGYKGELTSFDLYADISSYANIEGYPNLVLANDLVLYGNAALTDNMENKTGSNNMKIYIDRCNEKASVINDQSSVHVEMPNGSGGAISGKVEPKVVPINNTKTTTKGVTRGGTKGTVGGYVGGDSHVYDALEIARKYNKEALEIAGQTQEIKDQFEVMLGGVNDLIDIINDVDNFVNVEVKRVIATNLVTLQQQKDVSKARVMSTARKQINIMNKNISAYNADVAKLERYIDKYMASYEEEDEEPLEFPRFEPFETEEYLEYVESFLSPVDAGMEYIDIDVSEFDFTFGLVDGGYGIGHIEFDLDDYYVQDVLSTGTEYLQTSMDALDTTKEYYDKVNGYVDEFDGYLDGDYPAFSKDENGIVEFKPKDDKFVMCLMEYMDFLEGTGVQVSGRFGWQEQPDDPNKEVDTDLYFYSFAVGYISTPVSADDKGKEDEKGADDKKEEAKVEPTGIPLGVMEIQNLVAVVGYNMIMPYSESEGYNIGSGKELFDSIDKLQIDMENNGDYFFAATADAYLMNTKDSHIGALKDMAIIIESNGSFEISAEYWGPKQIIQMVEPSPNNSEKLYGAARIGYNSREENFLLQMTVQDIYVQPTFKVSGSIGFNWGKDCWSYKIGYPDSLALEETTLNLKGGFGLQMGTNEYTGNLMFQVKMSLDFHKDIDVGIVYADVGAYIALEVGYGTWNIEQEQFPWYKDGAAFEGIGGYLKMGGHLKGGIAIPGVGRYDIISLQIDADASIINPREDIAFLMKDNKYYAAPSDLSDKDDWLLHASIYIAYSLDLWFDEYKGSFDYDFEMTI